MRYLLIAAIWILVTAYYVFVSSLEPLTEDGTITHSGVLARASCFDRLTSDFFLIGIKTNNTAESSNYEEFGFSLRVNDVCSDEYFRPMLGKKATVYTNQNYTLGLVIDGEIIIDPASKVSEFNKSRTSFFVGFLGVVGTFVTLIAGRGRKRS